MKIQIRKSNLQLTQNIIDYVERRLHFALGRFGETISGVMVRLSDLNGPRGGVDKNCQVSVQLLRSKMLIIEEKDADLFTAIALASERMGRAVTRATERRRSLNKEGRIYSFEEF